MHQHISIGIEMGVACFSSLDSGLSSSTLKGSFLRFVVDLGCWYILVNTVGRKKGGLAAREKI